MQHVVGVGALIAGMSSRAMINVLAVVVGRSDDEGGGGAGRKRKSEVGVGRSGAMRITKDPEWWDEQVRTSNWKEAG